MPHHGDIQSVALVTGGAHGDCRGSVHPLAATQTCLLFYPAFRNAPSHTSELCKVQTITERYIPPRVKAGLGGEGVRSSQSLAR